MVCVSVCGQDKCTERPKTNSDVFPQTLPSFRDSVSLWILVLTASIALLPTKPQGPSCLHPTQARELQAQSTRSPFIHGWQESCDLGVPQAFHWDVIQGSLTAETSCVFQRDADCREDPPPHTSSALYEPTHSYLSLGSVQAQHFLKGFLDSPTEETLLFLLSTTALGTHFLLMSCDSSLQILILACDLL